MSAWTSKRADAWRSQTLEAQHGYIREEVHALLFSSRTIASASTKLEAICSTHRLILRDIHSLSLDMRLFVFRYTWLKKAVDAMMGTLSQRPQRTFFCALVVHLPVRAGIARGRWVTRSNGKMRNTFGDLREAVLQRDGYCCRVCGTSGRRKRST
jgi:hypothetical protein